MNWWLFYAIKKAFDNMGCCVYCYYYCPNLFNKAWTQVLHRFKSCSWCVGDSRWWRSLTMVLTGNKAKYLLSVNHTTKAIHHHHIIWENEIHNFYDSSYFLYCCNLHDLFMRWQWNWSFCSNCYFLTSHTGLICYQKS